MRKLERTQQFWTTIIRKPLKERHKIVCVPDKNIAKVQCLPDTFKQLYRAIYNYLQVADFSLAKSFPSFEDGHFEVLLCEKILQSHTERRWIDV